MSIVIIFAALMVVIAAHELGHYLVAKKYGVIAESFNIGFGPCLLSTFKDKETGKRRVVCPIFNKKKYEHTGTPVNLKLLFFFGGSCAFNDADVEKIKPSSKVKIFAAGPAVNFVSGFIFYVSGLLLCAYNFFDAVVAYFVNFVTFIPTAVSSLVSVFMTDTTMLESAESMTDAVTSMPTFGEQLAVVFLLLGAANMIVTIINLIPFPSFDGGQIVCIIPEFFGKKMPEKLYNVITIGGFTFIMLYMCAFLIKDVINILF